MHHGNEFSESDSWSTAKFVNPETLLSNFRPAMVPLTNLSFHHRFLDILPQGDKTLLCLFLAFVVLHASETEHAMILGHKNL